MRLATTLEIRDIARQAFVTATGMCYDYKYAYTDKDNLLPSNMRRVSFALLGVDKGEKILGYMEQVLEKRGLEVLDLRLTDGGYIRCKAEMASNGV